MIRTMRDKTSAINIKNQLLYGALREKQAAVSINDIQRAMEAQRALLEGSVADRLGSTIEQRRREGAILGSLGGGLMGAAGGAAAGAHLSPKSKALMALLALGGVGVGGAAGNMLGRLSGTTGGALEGLLANVPGVRPSADFLAQPIFDN